MRIGVSQGISAGIVVGLCPVALIAAQEPPAGRRRAPVRDAAARGAGAGRGAGLALARRRSGRARSRPGALGEPLHRLSRVAGARLRDRSEHHPDEDRELRSLVLHAGQRARAVPEGGTSDAEREAERDRSPTRRSSALAHFLRQRVNDTMRGSALFTVGDILVGDAKAGEAYFNGAGGCADVSQRHRRAASSAFARAFPTTVDLQQRMLFPGAGPRRGRGPAAEGPAAPNPPNAVTVTVTPASGAAMSGVLVEQSDFYVTFRQADGTIRVVPHDRRQGRHDQSAAGAHRSAGPHHRQADSRSGGLPGEPEMRPWCIAAARLFAPRCRAAAAGTAPGSPA